MSTLFKVLPTHLPPACDMTTHVNLLRSQFVQARMLGLDTTPTEGPIPTPPDLTEAAFKKVTETFTSIDATPSLPGLSLVNTLTQRDKFNTYTPLNFLPVPTDSGVFQARPQFKGLFHDPDHVFPSTNSLFSLLRSLQIGQTPLKVVVKAPHIKPHISALEATHILTQAETDADITIISLSQLNDISPDHKGRIIIADQTPQEFANYKGRLDEWRESPNANLRNAILFSTVSALETTTPCAVVMIPDQATRQAYINVESHVRASLPVPTQLLLHHTCLGLPTTLDHPAHTINHLETAVNESYINYVNNTYSTSLSPKHHVSDQGASGATLSVFLVEKAKGKSVFVASIPYFSPESGMAKAAGFKIGVGALNTQLNWVEGMKQLVLSQTENTPNKAALVITAPNNPDGHIPSATELKELLLWTNQNNVSVIADLTYSELIYTGKENYKDLVTAFIDAKATVLFSHSKGRSLLGHRISSVICSDSAQISAIRDMRNTVTGLPSIISLIALQDSLTPTSEQNRATELSRFEKELNDNRNALIKLITDNQLQDTLSVPSIDGGLYVCVTVTGVSTEAIVNVAKEKKLLLLDQSNFGCDPSNSFFRISLSGDKTKKEMAFKTFIEAVKTVKKSGD